MNVNVRSILTKIDELATVLQINNVDIACVTETWLCDEKPAELVDIENYVCYRNDRRDGRRGGGVALYIKSNLPCQRLSDFEEANVESLWLLYRATRMPRQITHVVIGAVYHPPDGDNR